MSHGDHYRVDVSVRGEARRFAVSVHGYDLPIRDVDGTIVAGGLYTWRVVQAVTAEEAVAAAIRLIMTSKEYLDEIVDGTELVPKFEADEIRVMRDDDLRGGTGLIFYIETDAPS